MRCGSYLSQFDHFSLADSFEQAILPEMSAVLPGSANPPPVPGMLFPERPRLRAVGLANIVNNPTRFFLHQTWSLTAMNQPGLLKVDQTQLEFRPGDLILIPRLKSREWHYTGRGQHWFVHFLLPGQTEPAIGPPVLCRGVLPKAAIQERIRELQRMLATHTLHADVLLWDLLLRLEERLTPNLIPRRLQGLDSLIHEMESQLHDPPGMAVLARKMGCSIRQLQRLFLRERGKTVREHLRERRMALAGHLLRETTMPIRQIAVSLGFPNPQHFNKTVRRHFGMPPRKFRKA